MSIAQRTIQFLLWSFPILYVWPMAYWGGGGGWFLIVVDVNSCVDIVQFVLVHVNIVQLEDPFAQCAWSQLILELIKDKSVYIFVPTTLFVSQESLNSWPNKKPSKQHHGSLWAPKVRLVVFCWTRDLRLIFFFLLSLTWPLKHQHIYDPSSLPPFYFYSFLFAKACMTRNLISLWFLC